MRMWMINPALLCKNHLLGAHNELHKFRPSFVKQHKIDGRLFPVIQIEPSSMKKEHDNLVKEMIKRGYNHKSPYTMPDLSYLGDKVKIKVDREISIEDLKKRCNECKKRIERYEN